MAEAVFRQKVNEIGLSKYIEVDSAGTGDWHQGEPPHQGTIDKLNQNKINTDYLVARQIKQDDLKNFDYIIGMDQKNLLEIRSLSQDLKNVYLFMDFVKENKGIDVPDPYFTGNFEEVYQMVSHTTDEIIDFMKEKHTYLP